MKLLVGIRGSMTDVAYVEIVVRVVECVRAEFRWQKVQDIRREK